MSFVHLYPFVVSPGFCFTLYLLIWTMRTMHWRLLESVDVSVQYIRSTLGCTCIQEPKPRCQII